MAERKRPELTRTKETLLRSLKKVLSREPYDTVTVWGTYPPGPMNVRFSLNGGPHGTVYETWRWAKGDRWELVEYGTTEIPGQLDERVVVNK